jgi:hypothetical protein
MGWVLNCIARRCFIARKGTRYPLYRRLGGSQGRSGQVRKVCPPPSFDPRTSSPWRVAILTTLSRPRGEICLSYFMFENFQRIAVCVSSKLHQCFRGNSCCLYHFISGILSFYLCHFPARSTSTKFSRCFSSGMKSHIVSVGSFLLPWFEHADLNM